jgi:hypothetical protein
MVDPANAIGIHADGLSNGKRLRLEARFGSLYALRAWSGEAWWQSMTVKDRQATVVMCGNSSAVQQVLQVSQSSDEL